MHTRSLFASLALSLTCSLGLAQKATWPTWRGPTQNGLAAETAAPPLEWSEESNIRWKVALPGLGASTPVVLGERIFLTCAVPLAGAPPAGDFPPPSAEPHSYRVMAYSASSGDLLWQKSVHEETPGEPGHKTGSLASASICTDGTRLFAFFGSRGLYALDLEGEVLWSKDLGEMKTLAEFGEGATPVLHEDTLVVPWDHEGDSAVVAFDTTTGEERWRTERGTDSTWGSPVVASIDGSPQVILTGSNVTRGYDLKSGERVWSCSGMSQNPVNSPTVVDGVLYVMNSYKGQVVQALQLAGAEGELAESEHLLWTHNKSASYVPNPIVVDGLLYFLRNSTDVLNCLDARTGEEHYYGKRLGDLGTIHASPIAAAGRLYFASRTGVVAVVRAGDEFEVLAVNELDDSFDASPVAIADTLLLRGRHNLYCIATGDE